MDRSDALVQDGVGEKIDFLVRKIDRGFDMHARFRHRFVSECTAAENSPCIDRTAARAAWRRAAVDQIGDRFGLSEIDLVVQKGALAEFARPRHAAAEFETRVQAAYP